MTTLTARQRAILAFIVQYVGEHMTSPAVRDIGKAFGIRSPNGVAFHLRALRRKGYIEPARGAVRGIRVVGLAGLVREAASRFLATLPAEQRTSTRRPATTTSRG